MDINIHHFIHLVGPIEVRLVDTRHRGKPVSVEFMFKAPQGGNMASNPPVVTITDLENEPFELPFLDAKGNPADLTQLSGPPTVSVDNVALGSVGPVAIGTDGNYGTTFTTTGQLGTATLTVSATDSDGTAMSASGQIIINSSEPVTVQVSFGPPN